MSAEENVKNNIAGPTCDITAFRSLAFCQKASDPLMLPRELDTLVRVPILLVDAIC